MFRNIHHVKTVIIIHIWAEKNIRNRIVLSDKEKDIFNVIYIYKVLDKGTVDSNST